jgi:hypothetical protein
MLGQPIGKEMVVTVLLVPKIGDKLRKTMHKP